MAHVANRLPWYATGILHRSVDIDAYQACLDIRVGRYISCNINMYQVYLKERATDSILSCTMQDESFRWQVSTSRFVLRVLTPTLYCSALVAPV